jgi:glycosyltransferase involved in cell wall biosynthesis
MRIGVNGSFWGLYTTGSGQYIYHLLPALTDLAADNAYTLFLPRHLPLEDVSLRVSWDIQRLAAPFARLHENLAKVCFEQATYPVACQRSAMDIAHVPYFAPPLYCRIPVIVTIHDLIPLILSGYRGSWLVRSYMRLVSRAAQRACLVLTDSQASARDIERLLSIPPERIRVIYLAADSRYRPLSVAERQPVLERLKTPPRYLLYLGGFDRRKNVCAILQAFARMRKRLGDIALVIAGKLPARNSAFAPDPRLVSDGLGLGNMVHYTGWVAEEDKPALYAGATAFVFPSSYEGFGLPVLEAISCGTPAIVGMGSSLEEIAGPACLAVSPTAIDALAEAMGALVEDEPLRQNLAHQGLDHAQRFSWAATARQTLAAYHDALSPVPKP